MRGRVRAVMVLVLVTLGGSRAEAQCLAGIEVGGACWFLGALGESCTDVCGATGFPYDEATRTFAGSEGTAGNCTLVLDALGAPGTVVTEFPCDTDASIGCHVEPGGSFERIRCTRPTLPEAFVAGTSRACACQAVAAPSSAPALGTLGGGIALIAVAWIARSRLRRAST